MPEVRNSRELEYCEDEANRMEEYGMGWRAFVATSEV